MERSLPTIALVFVNWFPVICTPSPESPAKRIVTFSTTDFPLDLVPASYGKNGNNTFIINEENTLYKRDLGVGIRIYRWPADLKAEGWNTLE